MKVLKSLIFLFVLIVISKPSVASHMMGSDMYYKHLGGKKYEFTIKYYRDCRGIPFQIASCNISCPSGTIKKVVPLTLRSIREITPICKNDSTRCLPTNKASGDGIEEHVYSTIIDFDSSDYSSFLLCAGELIVSTSQCCRNGAITTGVTGNFYTEIILDFDIATDSNSSPVFEIPPVFKTVANETFTYALGAVDSTDYDSLSFSFTDPQSAHLMSLGYTGALLSKDQPFDAYYPAGTAPPYSNPNVIPAIGIYLDPFSGSITATPVTNNQVTVMVVLVEEWRKDSLGVYHKIGASRRDVEFAVESTPLNKIPVIEFDSLLSRGHGAGCVSFKVTDTEIGPGSVAPDTLEIKLIGDKTHLSMTIDSTVYNGLNTSVYGNVCYDSTWSISGDNSIYLYVRDDNCPWNAEASKGAVVDFPTRSLFKEVNSLYRLSESQIELYPNPASGSVSISYGKTINHGFIDVIDLNGSVALQKEIQSQDKTELNIQRLSAGLYVVRISYEDETAYLRLVVE